MAYSLCLVETGLDKQDTQTLKQRLTDIKSIIVILSCSFPYCYFAELKKLGAKLGGGGCK
jgi:hypothetical protein